MHHVLLIRMVVINIKFGQELKKYNLTLTLSILLPPLFHSFENLVSGSTTRPLAQKKERGGGAQYGFGLCPVITDPVEKTYLLISTIQKFHAKQHDTDCTNKIFSLL